MQLATNEDSQRQGHRYYSRPKVKVLLHTNCLIKLRFR